MIPQAKKTAETADFCFAGDFALQGDFGEYSGRCARRIAGALTGQGSVPLRLAISGSGHTEYDLTVAPECIEITATEEGVFPALAALQNRIENGAVRCGQVTDRARFSHRGYMQDDARHFQGADAAIELLEILFRFKMNVFHWHISDDQAFRLQLPGYERLAEHSSKRTSSHVGGYIRNRADGVPYAAIYSREDVDRVLEAAKERGINVIPEIDMPGHFSAILSAYPEYSCDGKQIEVPGRYGVLENTLCLGKKESREFAKKLALDVARYLDADTIHIGFDEIKTGKMCACPDCRAEAERRHLSSPKELIPMFRNEVRDALAEQGIRAIAWDDENSLKGPDENITVMHWRPESDRQSADRINHGQKAILCDFYHHYADYPYCMTPLKKTYYRDPVIRGVTAEENVVGLETPLWAEFVSTAEKRELNAFYRIAAVAQNAWNAPAERPDYRSFITELRQREEYYFGKRLDAPESLLNPTLPRRLSRLVKCMLFDSDYEVRLWNRSRKE